MKKRWITAALILLGIGVLVCVGTYLFAGFDAGKMSTEKLVTNTYAVDEKFSNIEIDVDVDKVVFLPANDGACKVVCREYANQPQIVKVEGDTLTITVPRQKSAFGIWSIRAETPEVKVYLPERSYGALSVSDSTGAVDLPKDFLFKSIRLSLDTGDARCCASAEGSIFVKTDTGNIVLSGLTAEEVELASDTGEMRVTGADTAADIRIIENTGSVTMENVRCQNLFSTGDTGSLTMTNVLASRVFDLERNTGDIRFDGCDAGEIYVKTDTGDITGTLLTEKVFLTETDTGSVKVPKTINGGRCEITTDTGDIKIEIKNTQA